ATAAALAAARHALLHVTDELVLGDLPVRGTHALGHAVEHALHEGIGDVGPGQDSLAVGHAVPQLVGVHREPAHAPPQPTTPPPPRRGPGPPKPPPPGTPPPPAPPPNPPPGNPPGPCCELPRVGPRMRASPTRRKNHLDRMGRVSGLRRAGGDGLRVPARAS